MGTPRHAPPRHHRTLFPDTMAFNKYCKKVVNNVSHGWSRAKCPSGTTITGGMCEDTKYYHGYIQHARFNHNGHGHGGAGEMDCYTKHNKNSRAEAICCK